jgi:hypothetical protein
VGCSHPRLLVLVRSAPEIPPSSPPHLLPFSPPPLRSPLPVWRTVDDWGSLSTQLALLSSPSPMLLLRQGLRSPCPSDRQWQEATKHVPSSHPLALPRAPSPCCVIPSTTPPPVLLPMAACSGALSFSCTISSHLTRPSLCPRDPAPECQSTPIWQSPTRTRRREKEGRPNRAKSWARVCGVRQCAG